MYERLIDNYEIIFEGIPDPIFYGRYYPMGHKREPYRDELWNLFNYGRGLKKDKDPSAELYTRFEDDYEADLRSLLNCVVKDTKSSRRGVVVIPSSKQETTNRVTELVRRILASNPGPFADLTDNLIRLRERHAAHDGGDRSISSNIESLEFQPCDLLSQYDSILVIDDIVTTGNSFRAANEVLRRAGFTGVIINFAFSRTFPSDGTILCLEASRDNMHITNATGDYLDEHWSNHPIDGLILDLDQTLIDDPIRNTAYEEVLWKDFRQNITANPYNIYDGINEILELHLPTAILSNRPISEIEHIIADSLPQIAAYRDNTRGAELPIKIFSFPVEQCETYTIRYYKPSTKGVEEVAKYLQSLCDPCTYTNKLRILGIGNTKEDIVAYNNANIDSALALWGVPNYLRDYAAKHWSAAYVFSTPQELAQSRGKLGGYYERAVFYDSESRDKTRALNYYRDAIKHDDHVKEAAFQLAYAVANDNPEKAIELYGLSIAAGDEFVSTNNLALLIADEDPNRAKELYERAIAAGNIKTAARNLALLTMREKPDQAIELLRRAAQAGNTKHLAEDIKPALIAGNENAIKLYQEYAEGNVDQKAKQLAILLEEMSSETAIPLLEAAIANGDEAYATRHLALKLLNEDTDRAIELLARAAKAGNIDHLFADLKPLIVSGNKYAIRLTEEKIIAKDPKQAFNLAMLVANTNKDLAIELYERAIAAGETYYATNNLANLIVQEEPERAKKLYEQAMNSGDRYYAPRNLALLIIGDNLDRAVNLLGIAAKNGNKRNLATDLKPIIKGGNLKAIKLYEKTIVEEDEIKANDLAALIEPYMPEKAKELYRRAIAAGDERYATFNLAVMLEKSDPDEAAILYERAIEAGDNEWATNNLGALVVSKDSDRSRALFLQAIEAGDEICATCNLAHMYIPIDAERAASLYERSLQCSDETDAKLGLSYLLRDRQPEKASNLLEQAFTATNMELSFEFLITIVAACDRKTAFNITRYISDSGYQVAWETLIKLSFGDKYNQETNTINFGHDIESGEQISWLALGPVCNGILFLSKYIIKNMSFIEGAPAATWEDSAIRSWLNGPFLKYGFSSEEAESMILQPELGDVIFCLSESDLKNFVPEKTRRATRIPLELDKLVKWWLRPENGSTLSAPCVNEEGKAAWTFALVEQGVRPAIILRI